MLKLYIPGPEGWDAEKEEFFNADGVTVELEHSLVSLSKWESIWEKPFLDEADKTDEETLSYIECMIIDPKIAPEDLPKLTKNNLEQINDYINAKMTATWFTEMPGRTKNTETITSELVYYWLVAFTIPFETETWHLNRLLTLIKICSIKNEKPKKMSRSEIADRNRMLNDQRKAKFKTSG